METMKCRPHYSTNNWQSAMQVGMHSLNAQCPQRIHITKITDFLPGDCVI